MKKLQEAYEFAVKCHKGQVRKSSNIPYITHPIQVVHILSHVVGIKDEDVLITAVLHDVVEDCGISVEEIEEKFGSRVAKNVNYLSRPDKNSKTFKDKYEYLKKFSKQIF